MDSVGASRTEAVGLVAELFGNLVALGGEIDLLGEFLIVEIALDMFPTLHLAQNPHRHGIPGERIEIDAIGNVPDVAESVGEFSGEHLFEHDDRLIEIVSGAIALAISLRLSGLEA